MIFVASRSTLGGALVLVAPLSAALLVLYYGMPSYVGVGRQLSLALEVVHVEANSSSNFSARHFESDTWPMLKNKLCPKGVPNLDLATTLFHLARIEVFGSDNAVKVVEEPPSEFVSKFYDGNFGASTYTDENKKLVTLYARIFKCGNNQIRNMEKKLWSDRRGIYNSTASMRDVLTRHIPSQKSDLSLIRHTNEERKPCIFTVIRDPISHFLSGYNEVEYRILNDVDLNRKPALAPYNKISYSSSDQSRKERFAQFVKDVIQEDSAFSDHYVYLHFMPMGRILPNLDRFNQSLTGYLPSLDNLTRTWPAFMAKTCPNVPPLEEMPEMGLAGQHGSSSDPLGVYHAAKEVWKDRGPIARAMCILHAFDYACWDALPGGIPEFCQTVFGNNIFSAEIITRVPT